MNAVDAEIIRDIRRELAKRPINADRIDIQCVNGRVTLGGVTAIMRDHPDADADYELAQLERILTRDNKVKHVVILVKVLKEDKEEHSDDPRGRMRQGGGG